MERIYPAMSELHSGHELKTNINFNEIETRNCRSVIFGYVHMCISIATYRYNGLFNMKQYKIIWIFNASDLDLCPPPPPPPHTHTHTHTHTQNNNNNNFVVRGYKKNDKKSPSDAVGQWVSKIMLMELVMITRQTKDNIICFTLMLS